MLFLIKIQSERNKAGMRSLYLTDMLKRSCNYFFYHKITLKIIIFSLFLLFFDCLSAYAYVDYGITGMIFQIGYVLFYLFISIIVIFLKPIKKMFLLIKKIFTKRKNDQS